MAWNAADVASTLTFGRIAQAAGAFLVAQVVFWIVRWILVNRRTAAIPGPKLGLLGPLPSIARNLHQLYDWDTSHFDEFGPTFRITDAFWKPRVNVWTKCPKNIEYFLKTNFRNYNKPDDLRARLTDLIGNGIFRINHGYDDGEYPIWHAQRKTMSRIFFKSNFDCFLQRVFVRHSRELCDVLREHAAAGTPVDAQKLMFAFTLDSIAEIGFGMSFNALREPMSVGTAFDEAQEGSFSRVLIPGWQIPVLGNLLYPSERRRVRLIRELDEFSERTIRERRAAIAKAAATAADNSGDVATAAAPSPASGAAGGGGAVKGEKDGKKKKKKLGAAVGEDCLSLFLKADAAKTAKFSDKQLRDVVMSVLIAGRDTTACTLSFAVAELMLNPDVAAKLRAEMANKLAHTTLFGGDAPVGMEDVTQRNMPYLHGYVYEMLRLHPPVPMDAKMAVKDDTWPDGTRIPAGTVVVFSPYAMGRDSTRWPDPLQVRPERWQTSSPSAFEFPQFQAGPRICLGLRMAVLEAKINLAYVVTGFDFRPAEGCVLPPRYKVRLTQSILGGLPVHVAERR